jgi:undecaprenyl-diphosphatase
MTLLSIIIVLTGISRMYLGVHYPSDVIGGFLITGAYLIVFISYIDRKVYKNLK